jgi:DNA-binding NarL/FixJ family response regulator
MDHVPESSARPVLSHNVQEVTGTLWGFVERYELSAREAGVLLLTIEGLCDKEIADRLGCSRSSISTYWCRIFSKTGSRPQRAVLSHIARTAAERADQAIAELSSLSRRVK